MASHLEAFFTHGAVPCGVPPSQLAARTAAVSSQEEQETRERDELVYVHAATDVGLTSLLLQFGFTRAQAGKRVVLLLCGENARSYKPTIVRLQPCLHCGVPAKTGMDNEIWGRIQIKYIKSSAELQHFACSLHLMRDKSSVVLVDSFERFFIEESAGAVYQTLALLFEARRYMAASTGFGEVVLTGHSLAFVLRDHQRLHRWCRFLEVSSDGDEFILHEEIVDGGGQGVENEDDQEQDDDGHSDLAIRFEYSLPGSMTPEGSFRLLDVIYRHAD